MQSSILKFIVTWTEIYKYITIHATVCVCAHFHVQCGGAEAMLSCCLCNHQGSCNVSSWWPLCCHPHSCCGAPGHLMSASARWTHLMALPVVLFSWESGRRLERWFWAKLQRQHGSRGKPSLKAKPVKSAITLLCLRTVCCHWGEPL